MADWRACDLRHRSFDAQALTPRSHHEAALPIREAVVVRGASGPPWLVKILPTLGDTIASGQIDAVLAVLLGGEPLFEAVLGAGPARPVSIAVSTTSDADTSRRTSALGANLAAVRLHDLERRSPIS